jgi:hypothetical protein
MKVFTAIGVRQAHGLNIARKAALHQGGMLLRMDSILATGA